VSIPFKDGVKVFSKSKNWDGEEILSSLPIQYRLPLWLVIGTA
jgi:hypothetical protein